nr:class D beta-lactamase [Nitratireductor sp. OM-1]
MKAVDLRIFLILIAMASFSLSAKADTVCTLILDAASEHVLMEEGDCQSRVTPASTFKVPLAVMAYDAGILRNSHEPVWAFQAGDPDWGGANWTRNTDPTDWMRYSVIWYSQRITRTIGEQVLARYAQDFGYGNADFSGDPGFGNGLERAWVASSLLVSPVEQAAFLRSLVLETLPVSPQAMQNARAIIQSWQTGNWVIYGKTGTAYPRRADRSFDYARGWGWFVGWAQDGDRKLVFVRLTQANERMEMSPGNLTRDAFLSDWSVLFD